LPISIPTPIAKGEQGEGYPWPWSIYRWIDGANATIESTGTSIEAAIQLATFIRALQQIDTSGASTHERGEPLSTRDAQTRECLLKIRDMIDFDAAVAAWNDALSPTQWTQAPRWFHGDLHHDNLLTSPHGDGSRLSAIIDFGLMGVGDPACDLMSAWGLFCGDARDAFRTTLAVDDASWQRGRGFALSQAAIYIPYYLNTKSVGVRNALRTIDQVIADFNLKRCA
jgi:aminoglycoside phosphotransferase (APT) family kinase protein